MNKVYVTEQQIELLSDAYQSTLGTPNYTKYRCAWWFKSRQTGQWKFSIYGSPSSMTGGFFKKVRGEVFIYSKDETERIQLNEACKELLNIK